MLPLSLPFIDCHADKAPPLLLPIYGLHDAYFRRAVCYTTTKPYAAGSTDRLCGIAYHWIFHVSMQQVRYKQLFSLHMMM